MADDRARRLIAQYEQIAAERSTTESTWQDIADHLLGRRDFTTDRSPGEDRSRRLYDDTAKVASGLLSGAIHSLLTSPAAPWFELRYEDTRIQRIPAASVWLEDATTATRAAFARPRSRYHAQKAEFYQDLINFGTAVFYIEDVPGVGTRFSARPLSEIFFAEDASGEPSAIFRRFKLRPRQAIEMFGPADEMAQRKAEAGNDKDRATYLHAVYRRSDPIFGRLDASGMAWESVYLSLDGMKVLDDGGFHELPYIITRWSKDAGETYGRGPGWDALSDGKMLNEMKRTLLIAGEKAIDPPTYSEEGVLGEVLVTFPGAHFTIDSTAAMRMNPPIQSLPPDLRNFPITAQILEDTRRQVQDAYQHSLLEFLRNPAMTATQVLELVAQMQRHLAPILGRLQTESLEPEVDRVFGIESRAGRIPPPPPELAGMPLRIEFVSPIARAQRAQDAKAVIDLFTVGANLSQADPAVMDVLDSDEAARFLQDALGAPARVIRSPKQVAAIRAARAEQAEEAEAQASMQAHAEAIGKVAPAMQRGAA